MKSTINPTVQGISLIPTSRLPDRFRTIFPYTYFNAVQSKCFGTIYEKDVNLVVSAPTGSGKTVIFELAICRLVLDQRADNWKIVYLAPTKALCYEKSGDWSKKLQNIGLKCVLITGDTDQNDQNLVRQANLIVTTPEKWDSMTRKLKDQERLMQLVRLFLVDEVHILKESRGATLEAVVSRMKFAKQNIRFVTLSATVPNSQDIATWLGLNAQNRHLPAKLEVFGEKFRPVPLEKHVYSIKGVQNDFAFEKLCTEK
jgi:ATP-dependent DNA helicase HFM1/MER3